METSAPSRQVVRPYRREDRDAIRKICADTGFLGEPIDPVFEDRELFADYLTAYYTDVEPESTFVCLHDGEVKGYIMGSRFPKRKARYERLHVPLLALRGAWRYLARPYNAASRRYVRWILTQARHEVPFTPPDMAHFHFNVLPEARGVGAMREFINVFFAYLTAHGEKQVYGQVVSFGTRRSERMFARYGFRVVDQREVTKYREFYPDKVLLFTVVKDLALNPFIYGTDLHKASPESARAGN
jgi:GNAT superfamily N-acetyltransferase